MRRVTDNLFAHLVDIPARGGKVWQHVYPAKFAVRGCMIKGETEEDILPVVVRDLLKGEKSVYWAWWDAGDSEFCHIYPGRDLVEFCFPYGTKVEEEAGKGELVNVAVFEYEEEMCPCGRNPAGDGECPVNKAERKHAEEYVEPVDCPCCDECRKKCTEDPR